MKKSINKLSKELRDAIIKEIPSAESINYKGVTMSNNAPAWFQEFEKKNDEHWERQETFNKNQESFNKNQEAFNKRIEAKVDKLYTLPTIKKELAT